MATDVAEELAASVKKVVDDPKIAMAVVRQMIRDFGGTQLYLPLERSAFRREIAKEIYDRYDGTNTRDICKEYNISCATMYEIIRQEKTHRAMSRDEADQCLLLFPD